ncbi:hypothetical protein QLL95_gp0520 [Cotonvirus japonicus]|uniref:Uncharacterized protein n=1 Tax=Cotonvirus japonicus TaxID=2811091 RepID=A0ABM7NTV4_9VIRU|nr:hypothetical protein QLL95_gp0520 [Cotonvirus japonicus]BCS83603.1 hypothetical protein [Cotonvirus japonicus]
MYAFNKLPFPESKIHHNFTYHAGLFLNETHHNGRFCYNANGHDLVEFEPENPTISDLENLLGLDHKQTQTKYNEEYYRQLFETFNKDYTKNPSTEFVDIMRQMIEPHIDCLPKDLRIFVMIYFVLIERKYSKK